MDIKIEDFFNTDYVDAASYDNLRKISSYIDGLKNCSRKITYTLIGKNINTKTKLSRLQSTVSYETEYLHGEDGIAKVMVGMAQNFSGSNNIPLLQRNGNFGNRLSPVAAASRYIYTQKEKYLENLFRKDDDDVLIEQYFEGIRIEPRFFVPIIPMLIVNGSEGISTGFAQKILSRDHKKVISELKKVLKGTKKIENINLGSPHWDGFSGEIKQDEEKSSKWHIYGKINIENKNNIIVEELPVGYDLKKYISILDKLQDDNIISSYKDYSEDDKFKFKIKVKREFFDYYDDDESIYNKLKLRVQITENYTTIDEFNRIKVFDNVEDIFRSYFKVRMDFFSKRKEYIISKMEKDIELLSSKHLFIKSVINGDIVVNNKPKKNIVSQIDKIDKIIEIDDNYDYLLRMPIYSLTKEKLDEIKNKIKSLTDTLKEYKKVSLSDLWLKDIDDLNI